MTRKPLTAGTMLQRIVVYAESKFGCSAKIVEHPQPADSDRFRLAERLDRLQAKLDADPDDTDLADEVAELASLVTVRRFELIVGNGLDIRKKYTGQTLLEIIHPLYGDFGEDFRETSQTPDAG